MTKIIIKKIYECLGFERNKWKSCKEWREEVRKKKEKIEVWLRKHSRGKVCEKKGKGKKGKEKRKERGKRKEREWLERTKVKVIVRRERKEGKEKV